ncbi:hypothetical protein ACFWPQ_38015 [Streptomyces sp. NPDC058464]|uniref:hypothetical protein n=1 Tax=Streptomyces sp. NPDC058464 TaxID=3346511 RepID=UPI00364FCA04
MDVLDSRCGEARVQVLRGGTGGLVLDRVQGPLAGEELLCDVHGVTGDLQVDADLVQPASDGLREFVGTGDAEDFDREALRITWHGQ